MTNNKEKRRNTKRCNKQNTIRRHAKFLRVRALKKCCKLCRETHPACLDFHHKDPDQKVVMNVAKLISKNYGWERILAEIAKCDVICANCHRKLHDDELPGGCHGNCA